ncbi:hypothetical protein GCM10010289_76030 [Streptomyces violascens]|uniref:Uncharacterized protein n=1 Tax=Streptomyces violascens TaxID=67381 RepID=A0ABQ3QV90_9ACTN|nr:hypothetical protein GCM10010289_76030 [Streptomyces violascens]GHI41170.1 hypothetical protein Sviol_55780 [Streptomyces violascens]
MAGGAGTERAAADIQKTPKTEDEERGGEPGRARTAQRREGGERGHCYAHSNPAGQPREADYLSTFGTVAGGITASCVGFSVIEKDTVNFAASLSVE